MKNIVKCPACLYFIHLLRVNTAEIFYICGSIKHWLVKYFIRQSENVTQFSECWPGKPWNLSLFLSQCNHESAMASYLLYSSSSRSGGSSISNPSLPLPHSEFEDILKTSLSNCERKRTDDFMNSVYILHMHFLEDFLESLI